ncbi:MAG: tetratricopeptide repeat protein [Desulfovibrionales bacterium]|nr:tetratricopeptide repeat protein [Desulfovibrionales bacterium]
MKDAVSEKMKFKQYETFVVDFFSAQKGHVVVVSDDNNFTTLLRQTLSKHLGIQKNVLTLISDVDDVIRAVNAETSRGKNLLVFLERVYKGKEMAYLVRQIKAAYSNAKIIILTSEAAREQLVLLHEIGSDNFITKPIAINTLIEKVAFTIKPQGKLGQLIDIAKSMVARGAYDQAIKASRQILELKPNSAAGLLVMGDAYKGLEKFEKARDCYMQAADSAPMYLEPLKKMSELFDVMEQKKDRLNCLVKLDVLSPLNVERKIDIGELHVDMGNFQDADRFFENAIKQATREALAYVGDVSQRIAMMYAQLDPLRSERYLRKALSAKGNMLEKTDLTIFNRLGIALRKQGKWNEAIREYERALQISRNDENLYYNMAIAAAEGKDFRRSAAYLRNVLLIDKSFPEQDANLAYNMGLIFSKTADREQARTLLRTCLSMMPTHASAAKLISSL